jgi:hypothetical protein
VEQNREAGQNPPRVVAPWEEEEYITSHEFSANEMLNRKLQVQSINTSFISLPQQTELWM